MSCCQRGVWVQQSSTEEKDGSNTNGSAPDHQLAAARIGCMAEVHACSMACAGSGPDSCRAQCCAQGQSTPAGHPKRQAVIAQVEPSCSGRGGAGRRVCIRLSVLMLSLCAGTLVGSTPASEVEALLAFKGALNNPELLPWWREDSDPCMDGWPGLYCNCHTFDDLVHRDSVNCQTVDSEQQHVVVLDLSSSGVAGFPWRAPLSGTISASLGTLKHLLLLNLEGNLLTGPLPLSLSNLTSLMTLSVSYNQLQGELPGWLGALEGLELAGFNNNNFTGPVPVEWCDNDPRGLVYRIHGNAALCGAVPHCLREAIAMLNGTSIAGIAPSDDQDDIYKCCNTQKPLCDPEQGCHIDVPHWYVTSNRVTFNFTAFDDPQGDPLRYVWSLDFMMHKTLGGPWNLIPTGPLSSVNDTLPMLDNLADMEPDSIAVTQVVTQDGQLYVVNASLPHHIKLQHGSEVYIWLMAINIECPLTRALYRSSSVTVDLFPPRAGIVHNTAAFESIQHQDWHQPLGFSFDDFTDAVPIVHYTYQVWQESPDRLPVTNPIVADGNSMTLYDLQLPPVDAVYFTRVCGTDEAGWSTCADSPYMQVTGESTPPVDHWVYILLVVLSLIAILGAFGYIMGYALVLRRRREHAERQALQEGMKAIVGLMQAMEEEKHTLKDLDDFFDAIHAMALVITDLESSTAQAHADRAAYKIVQDIHDTILREALSKSNGYEINTEGDSFHCAFTDVASAVRFCLDVQYELLHADWPKAVLKLPACNRVLDSDNALMFNGPRVRMGIHWAAQGTIGLRQHMLTKHWVFSGPGFQLAQELGDAANGGQILMTGHAWGQLIGHMHETGYPVVHEIGLFEMKKWPAPMWLYEVKERLAFPVRRSFPDPRDIQRLGHGRGFNIMPPPHVDACDAPLAFVAVRFEIPANTALTRGRKNTLPPWLGPEVHRVLGVAAIMTNGFLFKANYESCRFVLAFGDSLSALRFCMVSQGYLMLAPWDPDPFQLLGATVRAADGRLTFRGPRMAMALHETSNYRVTERVVLGTTGEELAMEYVGPGVELAMEVATCVSGAQVVVTGETWRTLADSVPLQCRVLSLGTHVLSDRFPTPMLLMEVTPQMLARRTFEAPRTQACLGPGYRDSPDPSHDMAIVFCKVHKPRIVEDAEELTRPNTSTYAWMFDVLTVYNVAVMELGEVVRELLSVYDGYECKEPEAGKFTIAFGDLEMAVRWGCALQLRLLEHDWPDSLLEWEDCRPVADDMGQIIWRGLRVKLGMAWGKPDQRKPLCTGRADYFGALPNLAARVCAHAAPGQALLDMYPRLMKAVSWTIPNYHTIDPPVLAYLGNSIMDSNAIYVIPVGEYKLKGFESRVNTLVQLSPKQLVKRTFPSKAAIPFETLMQEGYRPLSWIKKRHAGMKQLPSMKGKLLGGSAWTFVRGQRAGSGQTSYGADLYSEHDTILRPERLPTDGAASAPGDIQSDIGHSLPAFSSSILKSVFHPDLPAAHSLPCGNLHAALQLQPPARQHLTSHPPHHAHDNPPSATDTQQPTRSSEWAGLRGNFHSIDSSDCPPDEDHRFAFGGVYSNLRGPRSRQGEYMSTAAGDHVATSQEQLYGRCCSPFSGLDRLSTITSRTTSSTTARTEPKAPSMARASGSTAVSSRKAMARVAMPCAVPSMKHRHSAATESAQGTNQSDQGTMQSDQHTTQSDQGTTQSGLQDVVAQQQQPGLSHTDDLIEVDEQVKAAVPASASHEQPSQNEVARRASSNMLFAHTGQSFTSLQADQPKPAASQKGSAYPSEDEEEDALPATWDPPRDTWTPRHDLIRHTYTPPVAALVAASSLHNSYKRSRSYGNLPVTSQDVLMGRSTAEHRCQDSEQHIDARCSTDPILLIGSLGSSIKTAWGRVRRIASAHQVYDALPASNDADNAHGSDMPAFKRARSGKQRSHADGQWDLGAVNVVEEEDCESDDRGKNYATGMDAPSTNMHTQGQEHCSASSAQCYESACKSGTTQQLSTTSNMAHAGIRQQVQQQQLRTRCASADLSVDQVNHEQHQSVLANEGVAGVLGNRPHEGSVEHSKAATPSEGDATAMDKVDGRVVQYAMRRGGAEPVEHDIQQTKGQDPQATASKHKSSRFRAYVHKSKALAQHLVHSTGSSHTPTPHVELQPALSDSSPPCEAAVPSTAAGAAQPSIPEAQRMSQAQQPGGNQSQHGKQRWDQYSLDPHAAAASPQRASVGWGSSHRARRNSGSAQDELDALQQHNMRRGLQSRQSPWPAHSPGTTQTNVRRNKDSFLSESVADLSKYRPHSLGPQSVRHPESSLPRTNAESWVALHAHDNGLAPSAQDVQALTSSPTFQQDTSRPLGMRHHHYSAVPAVSSTPELFYGSTQLRQQPSGQDEAGSSTALHPQGGEGRRYHMVQDVQVPSSSGRYPSHDSVPSGGNPRRSELHGSDHYHQSTWSAVLASGQELSASPDEADRAFSHPVAAAHASRYVTSIASSTDKAQVASAADLLAVDNTCGVDEVPAVTDNRHIRSSASSTHHTELSGMPRNAVGSTFDVAESGGDAASAPALHFSEQYDSRSIRRIGHGAARGEPPGPLLSPVQGLHYVPLTLAGSSIDSTDRMPLDTPAATLQRGLSAGRTRRLMTAGPNQPNSWAHQVRRHRHELHELYARREALLFLESRKRVTDNLDGGGQRTQGAEQAETTSDRPTH